METHVTTNDQTKDLLIHADPGARLGAVGAWISNTLSGKSFDVGAQDGVNFHKIHYLNDVNELTNFDGIKIRIQPTYTMIDLHTLLFLRKNVYNQIPTFTKNEYSLETFTKLWEFVKITFDHNNSLNNNLYDYIITFDDTFNITAMLNLYQNIHQEDPTLAQINALVETNKLSNIQVNKNHSTSIIKLCLNMERDLSLKESERFWSIVDVYNTTSVDKLYDTVLEKIKPENYGILLNDTTTY